MEMMTPETVAPLAERAQGLINGIQRSILGQPELATSVVTSMIGGGHVLLEGLPGRENRIGQGHRATHRLPF